MKPTTLIALLPILLIAGSINVFSQSQYGVLSYSTPVGIPNSLFRCIAIDENNTKWFGHPSNGIVMRTESPEVANLNYIHYTIENSPLPSNQTVAISASGKTVAIATAAGIALIKNGQWTTYNHWNSPLPAQGFLSIHYHEKSKALYVGTDTGLFCLENGQWNQYSAQNSMMPGNQINCIETSHNGELWAGTNKGLVKIKPSWEVFPTHTGNILGLQSDRWGRLWISDLNKATLIRQGGKDYPLNAIYPSPVESVKYSKTFVRDKNGDIWSFGKDWDNSVLVTRFSYNTHNSYYILQDPIDASGRAILAPDHSGRLWFCPWIYAFWPNDRSIRPVANYQLLEGKGIRAEISNSFDLIGYGKLTTTDTSEIVLADLILPWFTARKYNMAVKAARHWYRYESDDFFPGPVMKDTVIVRDMTEGLFANFYSLYGEKYRKGWKVSKAEIEYHKVNYNKAFYTIPASIRDWPAHGDMSKGMNHLLAPFNDANGDGIYNPEYGDYPLIRGDEAVFFVFNTINPTGSLASPHEMKLEIRGMAYVFTSSNEEAIKNSLFVNYQVTNLAEIPYDDFSFGMFTAYRLSNHSYTDYSRYTGCDSLLNTCFGYRRKPLTTHSVNYPAFGMTWLNEPMSSFLRVFKSSDNTSFYPREPEHYFNMMRSSFSSGQPLVYGGDGMPVGPGPHIPCRFHFPGDPGQSGEWSEYSVNNVPGYRDVISAVTPRRLKPRETLCFDVAFTAALPLGSDSLAGVYLLKDYAQQNISFFNSRYSGNCSDIDYRQPTKLPAKPGGKILIYPNPTTDFMGIELDGRESEYVLDIYSITGKQVLSLVGRDRIIDVSGLEQGVYIVRILHDNELFSGKLIKLEKKAGL
jgi:hypothetical protein